MSKKSPRYTRDSRGNVVVGQGNVGAETAGVSYDSVGGVLRLEALERENACLREECESLRGAVGLLQGGIVARDGVIAAQSVSNLRLVDTYNAQLREVIGSMNAFQAGTFSGGAGDGVPVAEAPETRAEPVSDGLEPGAGI